MEYTRLDEKLDSLGRGVLQMLKAHDSVFADAVIAGGYLRDQIRGKPFKDIDIFLPKTDVMRLKTPDTLTIMNATREVFGHSGEYSQTFSVFNYKYLESIDIQIIITPFPKKDFVDNLLKSFDFGICQVFSTEEIIYGTKDYLYDESNGSATLVNIDDVSDLPKHIKRFLKFQEKYPGIFFRCPNLQIIQNEKSANPCKEIEFPFQNLADPYPDNPYDIIIDDLCWVDGSLNHDAISAFYDLEDQGLNEHINTLLQQYEVDHG